MELNKLCGKRLRELLEAGKISQVTLAEKTGVTPQYINNIINGRKPMTLSAAVRFSEVLGVSTNYLLGKSDYTEHIKHISELTEDEYDEQMHVMENCLFFILQSFDIHYHGYILELESGERYYYYNDEGRIPAIVINNREFELIREVNKIYVILLICERKFEIPVEDFRPFIEDLLEYFEFKSQKFIKCYTDKTPNFLLPEWFKD